MHGGGSGSTGGSKTRVAILGGGGGGVSAAYWLSSTAALRAQYDVTLFSRGWRLGGKGASGRDMAEGARIKEHGLHLLMGCYHNAFRTIRDCYTEWRPPAGNRFKVWTDAFAPQRSVSMWEGDPNDPWRVVLPRTPGEPGDSVAATLHDLLRKLLRWITDRQQDAPWWAEHAARAEVEAHLAALRRIHESDDMRPRAADAAGHLVALQDLHRAARPEAGVLSRDAERLWILLQIGMAMAKGVFEDVLAPVLVRSIAESLDRLNRQDFRGWLAGHGASRGSLSAPPISTIYELAFAYRNGDASDPTQASMAAGVTLRFTMELVLDYRDAPIWRMRAGMGDTVFTPFHQVLEARGVDIRLFHAIREVVPAADGRSVERIRIDRQAAIRKAPYRPFLRVRDLDVWPDQPLWDQLEDGARLRQSGVNFESVWDRTCVETFDWTRGRDFDLVVLAMPPEMLKLTAGALAMPGTPFARMLEASAAVATQSCQLWLAQPTDSLGPYRDAPIMSTLPEPYDSWGDMSELLEVEDWSLARPPRAIAYLCGAMQTPPVSNDPIQAANALARQAAVAWLDGNAASVWPDGSWDGSPLKGGGPIVSSYFRGNVEPSELYVLTPQDSVADRLRPAASGMENLFLAGDWTRTRFSGGCFESSIESGMLAAQAICGAPDDIAGED